MCCKASCSASHPPETPRFLDRPYGTCKRPNQLLHLADGRIDYEIKANRSLDLPQHAVVVLEIPSHPKISQQDLARAQIREEDILWFQISMDDPQLMDPLQTGDNSSHNRLGSGDRGAGVDQLMHCLRERVCDMKSR